MSRRRQGDGSHGFGLGWEWGGAPAITGDAAGTRDEAEDSWRRLVYGPWPLLDILMPPSLVCCGTALSLPWHSFGKRQGSHG